VVETLHGGARIAVHRATDPDGRPVILKVLGREHRPRDARRLQNEYDLGRLLDTTAVVRPLALGTYQGMPALVLEDWGGVPLDRLLGSPMEPRTFLRLAVRLATALAKLHAREVVHKDIKPHNILMRPDTGEVKFFDLGIASRLPREHKRPQPLQLIEASLPYMSPEQTTRVNRVIDRRSDLYSVGVVFYQLLTGRLPFAARDPLEWVHCHLARAPTPPVEIVRDVPDMLSRIVIKLLAKAAEERYHSAAGLQHDLQRCLDLLESTGTIEPFGLAECDIAVHLELPQRLYGRKRALDHLIELFDSAATGARPVVVTVTGGAGVGKSSLVREIHEPIVRARGWFLEGKFDQYRPNAPYATMGRAFRDLVLQLLSESEERVARRRQRLHEALDRNAQLIIELIPELELIMGSQPAPPPLPPLESRTRLLAVFRRFVAALAAPEHPLVLFLDDLQWADPASLELIEHLVTAPEVRGMLFIGAYRDNEVGGAHPVRLMLDRVAEVGETVHALTLRGLGRADVTRLIADALRDVPARVAPLAALVHAKTGGNPFFVNQFLSDLYEKRLLDHRAGAWHWSVEAIEAQRYTDNVVDLMVDRIKALPRPTQNLLKLSACVGSRAELDHLGLIAERSEAELERDMWPAVREDLVACADGVCRFLHDRVQQAAYTLIPAQERPAWHLRIGRQLYADTRPEALEDRLFDIVDHLNLGAKLIKDPAERTNLAQLNLLAGRRAKVATAFASAAAYFTFGAKLLPAESWNTCYEATCTLHLERAECELLTGNYEGARQLATLVLARGRTNLDRAWAYRISAEAALTEGAIERSVATTIEALRLFGIAMSPHPSREDVVAARARVAQLLAGRSIESLLELPPMVDDNIHAAMNLMSGLYAPAFFTDSNLFFVHLAEMVALSLQHGNTDGSVGAYGWYGFALICLFDEHATGHRFATAAYDLMDQRGYAASRGKANMCMELTGFWTQSIDIMLGYARTGFEAAVEVADLPAASFFCNHLVTDRLARGDALVEVMREAELRLDFVRKVRFRDIEDIIRCIQQFIKAMQGCTKNLGSLSDATFDEASFESQLTSRMTIMVAWYYILKMQARFMAGRYREAAAAAQKAEELSWATLGHSQYRDLVYYHSLVLAALCDTAAPDEVAAYRHQLERYQRRLSLWAADNPTTFRDQYELVSAEIWRLDGRDDLAGAAYEQAIRQAREGGFVVQEALAYELAAAFYQQRGFDRFAELYAGEALACYRRWGADGKVRWLEERHPHLRDRWADSADSTFTAAPFQLDLLSVLRASQAIAQELRVDALVCTLLRVLLEEGGGRTGYLMLHEDGALVLKAEARLDAGEVEVKMLPSIPVAESKLVPTSLINQALRTRDKVVLEDTPPAGLVAVDDYLERQRPRSLLCLPIVRNSELTALLYLENNLVAGAFSAERLAALELLAARAAVALENARLMDQERAARSRAETAEQRWSFLADASVQLSESMEVDEVVVRFAHLVVDQFAEWCVVDLVEETTIRRAAGVHRDPRRQPLLENLKRRYPPRWGSPHPSATVLRSGGPVLLPFVSRDQLRTLCEDDDHARLIHELGGRSAIALPLVSRGHLLGAVSIATGDPHQRFGVPELQLAQELAGRAAVAIDNARLYRQSLEAVRVRDEFISVASHELNTPMTNVLLTMEALLQPAQDRAVAPEQVLTFAQVTERHVRRIARLIGELLDVSRISGGLTLEPEDVDLSQVVAEVTGRMAAELARAGCRLLVRGAETRGRWDRSRLDQVLSNLLSNAAKFGAGQPIEICWQRDGAHAVLFVKDYGVGIPRDRQARIFERFERAASTENYGGLGLGLYISRHIVEAHGGTIGVTSEPACGTEMRVELPLDRPDMS
jgi:predicted ATPase/signal transduction histidine kinase